MNKLLVNLGKTYRERGYRVKQGGAYFPLMKSSEVDIKILKLATNQDPGQSDFSNFYGVFT